MDLEFQNLRHAMVEEQLVARGISDELVLAAFQKVERHRFMPEAERENSYADDAFPLSSGQTISQPYVVALMTEMLQVQPGQRVLEIGTGSGYQTAILLELGAQVVTVEQDPVLSASAASLLVELDYASVEAVHGNGWSGWPEHSPYDRIVVTCAPPELPSCLVEQLALNGRMVLPMGEAGDQHLRTVCKDSNGKISLGQGIRVRFVPMLRE